MYRYRYRTAGFILLSKKFKLSHRKIYKWISKIQTHGPTHRHTHRPTHRQTKPLRLATLTSFSRGFVSELICCPGSIEPCTVNLKHLESSCIALCYCWELVIMVNMQLGPKQKPYGNITRKTYFTKMTIAALFVNQFSIFFRILKPEIHIYL